VKISGVGVFPNIRSPRVLWAGVKGNDELTGLQQEIETGMTSLGFKQEKRRFRPHLTIGRFKSSKGAGVLIDNLERSKDIEIGSIDVRALYLMRSDLSPAGARYTRIAEIPLGRTEN
jgi:2'-5' RNA ligase